MKTGKLLFYINLIVFLTAVSCTDVMFREDIGRVEEGLPANIVLNVNASAGETITRAERDSISENQVENLYVFIFDEAGEIHERSFYTVGTGLDYSVTEKKGKVAIKTRSLNKARIVGIANLTTSSTSTAYSITKETLDGIGNFDALENLVMTMKENSVERYAIFMMTGFAKDSGGNTSINIPGTEGSGTETLECTLQLERTDAKIKFEITTEANPPAGTVWSDFSFLPKTWTVKNVPSQSYLIERMSGDFDGATAEYFDTPAISFETIDRNDDGRIYEGGSFIFYMPENRKTPKLQITDYAERDAWSGYAEGDKIFTNANDNSTYVEITGTLSYMENTFAKNADIRFIVHLGDTSSDINDYDTKRNTFYTYKIKVRGINDIVTEVETDNEIRPGYEGDIVTSESGYYEFDSHYDRCLIKINPANIGENIYWSVNTPFSRGVYEITGDEGQEVPESMRDYRWIKFAVNAEYGVDEGKFVKYPGDQNYNDPYPLSGAVHGTDYDAPSPYYEHNYPDARLMDINQLMIYLKQKKADGRTDEMTVTVFVDENLYFKNPITGEEDNEQRSLWKLTSDKEDRLMHLIVKDAKFSTDDNSSVITAEYTFRQRSIQTIFNVDKDELKTAWGLESKMETDRLKTGDVSSGSDSRNGRQNCLNWLVGRKWTDIIDTEGSAHALKDNYNNAAFACLLRNRDLNGDNNVDANEIRWYLAAIDQLTDIYLGEYALDEQSRLYPQNAADRENMVRWHYTSSSAYGNDAWILWAEEGASRGASGGSIDDYGSTNKLFSYRCVRNLGLKLTEPWAIPTDLIEVTKQPDGNYLIDVTNMNVKARRNTAEVNPLPNHNERSDINKPYARFLVHKDCFGYPVEAVNGGQVDAYTASTEDDAGYNWANRFNWEYYQTSDPSPDGYRIPNQREFLIMTSRLASSQWPSYSVTATYWVRDSRWGSISVRQHQESKTFENLFPDRYICQTAFSLNGKFPYNNGLRQGFLCDIKEGVFFLQNNKDEIGWIRPVKDYTGN